MSKTTNATMMRSLRGSFTAIETAAAARNAERVVSLISSSADLIAAMPPRLRDAAAAEMQERLRKIDLSWAPQISKR